MALSGIVSRATSGLDQREIKDVLEGHLTLEHKPVFKYIRIFLSSDQTDSEWDRKCLRKNVFPDLRRFCQSLGLQFHVVDLYDNLPTSWARGEVQERGEEEASGSGITCELELQEVLHLALWEIHMCQDVSAGPTFVTLLAQKYGHRPLPVHIPEEEYGQLCAVMEDAAGSRQLVQQWYKLDTNAEPPQYILQPSLAHDEHWVSSQESLSKTIRRAAKVALGKEPSKVQKYIMSATEGEVSVGIFQLKADPNHCCLWSKRTFTDLLDQKSHDPALPLFTDVTMGKKGVEFDVEAMKSLNHLKEARMTAKYIGLDASNIFEFPVKWQKNKGVDPDLCPPHSDYLSEMCEKVSGALHQQISDAAGLLELQSSNATHQEVLVHGAHCKKIVQKYMDRPEISSQIQSYLDGPSSHPLVVHGPTGYGKTALVASAAYHLREKNPLKKMAIVVRFLGLTPQSFSIFHTLRSISEQIAAVYGDDEVIISGDYQGVSSHFAKCLHSARPDLPLFLFLDAVDQLSPEDGAYGMSWLPLSLPPHVKLVLSTSSEVEYRCFPVLQSLLAKHPGNFVQVPALSVSHCQEMLSHYLAIEGRKLTSQQTEVAVAALQQCPVPLFLHLMMGEFKKWKSYTEIKNTFPTSMDGAVNSLFTLLEEKYGHVLISHLFGYITASKYGLTESEILDVLSLDAEVMAEVNSKFSHEDSTAMLSLPPVVWSRICHQIQPLLELRVGVNNSPVLQWSHRKLREIANSRYLSPHTTEIYGRLADYFSGGPQKRETEGVQSETQTPTIDHQPLVLNEEQALYNVRKLTELPHCLANSGRDEALKELLTDYQWLKACILSLPCKDILHDFTPVIPTVPICRDATASDHELRLLRQTLSYSTDVLNADSSQLCVQLAGRLLSYLTNTSDNSVLKNLVTTALRDVNPALTPLQPFSLVPGEPLLVSMEGHRDTVSCIATALVQKQGGVSLTIVSSSWDKTLKSWDLDTTGVLKTFDGHTEKVLSVALSADGLFAASGSEDKTVRYWYVPTAKCLHEMKGHMAAVNSVAMAQNGSKTISASSDATVKIWNTDQNSSFSGQVIYTLRNHKRPVLSLVVRGDVLVSGTSAGALFITNIISGEQLNVVRGHTGGVTALAAETIDNCCYLVSGSADGSLKVWEFSTCNLVHTLIPEGSDHAAITSVSIGPNGKIIASNSQREPGIWDVSNGNYLYSLSGHTNNVHCTTIADAGRLAITGSADHSLRVWDVLSPPVTQTTRLHSDDITSVVLSAYSNHGASASKDGTVRVFDTDTMNILQEIQPCSAAVNQLLVYKDTHKLFLASTDGTIRLWNGETGDVLMTFEGQGSPINCLAITAGKELLMSGGEGGEVAFWSIDTGKRLKMFSDHSSGVLVVAFLKQKKDHFMFSCSKTGELYIRDFQTAKVVASTQLHTGELVSTSLAPKSNVMVCGSNDSAAYVIALPQCTLKAVLAGHTAAVKAVKVFPDSIKCVTGSDDCTIRVWDTEEGVCLAVLCVDMPVLACDVNHSMVILYGTEGGWVSTAAYQSDPRSPNALISKLEGRDTPSVSSPSSASQSTLSCRTEAVQCEGDDDVDWEHDALRATEPDDQEGLHQLNSEGACSQTEPLPSSEQLVNSSKPCPDRMTPTDLESKRQQQQSQPELSSDMINTNGQGLQPPDESHVTTTNSSVRIPSKKVESSACMLL